MLGQVFVVEVSRSAVFTKKTSMIQARSAMSIQTIDR
jgi:hypothetical protein